VSGRFAHRNRKRLLEISKKNFVEIENHSLNHIQHMEKLRLEEVRKEVLENEEVLREITGKKTKFFRFPGGNYGNLSLRTVESIGYKVVHWTFPSGDPDKRITARRLKNWVLESTKSGSILIFHVNGRGYHTKDALPEIVSELAKRGFGFINLEDGLKAGGRNAMDFNSP
jgi:peptidoglycan/xylan/chitin deacetylase (PgdA/CDA1 family)